MNIKDVIKAEVDFVNHGNNIFSILDPIFRNHLYSFLKRYTAIQEKINRKNIPVDEYPLLPFSSSAVGEQWKFRKSSYRVMEKFLKHEPPKRILELSGWNGWLTHHLANWGNEVVTIDIFLDEINGLSAKKHYPQNWLAIQSDISNLDFLKIKFDVIIVNHCLAYMQDPLKFMRDLKNLLSINGRIIVLGMTVFKDSTKKAKETEEFKQHYKNNFDFDIFLRPTKAYLDLSDKDRLQSYGLRFIPYSDYRYRNLLSKIVKTKPEYLHGIYVNESL